MVSHKLEIDSHINHLKSEQAELEYMLNVFITLQSVLGTYT